MDNVLQLAAAFSGSMGFALLFQVRRANCFSPAWVAFWPGRCTWPWAR